ncbi:MalY/PatB family protein [Miniphocaeibacter massiliensis]|uniref:MalY/PatB family protein n=1 Tax=Miniphocaeibacter massiliensis TaxID=2041841 RepID=UPI000C1C663E|nr:MalY/PatB family protein [Miniphocaeibacter massiliensis]
MQYDFETSPTRKEEGSLKWKQMYSWNENIPDDVVPLSVADMEFLNPPEITEGLSEFAKKVVYGYTGPTMEYSEAVKSWMKNKHDFDIESDWIVNTSGVVTGFFTAVRAYTNVGDGVIIMTPVYYPFYNAVEKTGRKLVKNPLLNNNDYYEIDFENLDKLCQKEENKLIIFCSPHNPIGRVWKKEELEKLAEIAIRNNMIIVSDEIHNDIIMKGYKHTVLQTLSEKIADRTITCTAPSKTFNLAGLACSNIIIKNEMLREKYVKATQEVGSSIINIFGYEGCRLAYTKCEKWLEELLKVIEINRDLVVKFFEEKYPKITANPIEGTYLQWVNFKALGMDKDSLEKFMHEKAFFITDEGYIFGEEGDGYERINLAVPTKKLEICLNYLDNALKEIY